MAVNVYFLPSKECVASKFKATEHCDGKDMNSVCQNRLNHSACFEAAVLRRELLGTSEMELP
jgi:hypothetical protein